VAINKEKNGLFLLFGSLAHEARGSTSNINAPTLAAQNYNYRVFLVLRRKAELLLLAMREVLVLPEPR